MFKLHFSSLLKSRLFFFFSKSFCCCYIFFPLGLHLSPLFVISTVGYSGILLLCVTSKTKRRKKLKAVNSERCLRTASKDKLSEMLAAFLHSSGHLDTSFFLLLLLSLAVRFPLFLSLSRSLFPLRKNVLFYRFLIFFFQWNDQKKQATVEER